MRDVKVLRYGWRFWRGDFADVAAEEEVVGVDFDDSQWDVVRVPHDWAIEGPFSKDNDLQEGGKWTGATGGLPHVGKGWYRLRFNLPEEIKNRRKRVMVEFDGVMSHSRVYVNGSYVGTWPYGYSSFAFDITDFVKPGENLLVVSVDNKPEASRWYPGAGIYRNARFVIMEAVHVAHWGTYITTPLVSAAESRVHIQTIVENHLNNSEDVVIELETSILPKGGEVVASKSSRKYVPAAGAAKVVFEDELSIKHPLLWSIESPHLYIARSIVKVNGEIVDMYDTTFGIRSIAFHPEDGFLLNGKPVKFKGVCLHHDLGPLGAAVNKAALRRQLAIMKDMGANAIRTSHNPAAPELLDLADEMGFLVIEEAFDEWRIPKRPNGYNILFDEWAEKDLRAMIRRDRNHPCIIMWSIGNEIPEQSDRENGVRLARFLCNICKEEDPTRPTTAAIERCEDAIKNGFTDVIDVIGWNYAPHSYGRFHILFKHKPMYASETASCISTRGEYYFPVEEEMGKKRDTLQVNSYDLSHPPWGYTPDVEFRAQDEQPFMMGEFVWTGFDYLGEPTPYFEEWPSRSSYFGIVDLAGIPKDRFYLYQSRWAPEKGTLHLVPSHWSWHGYEGKIIPVHCYTKWEIVELFVNGKSQGIRRKSPKSFMERYRLIWNGVIYEPGELRAVAYNNDGSAAKEIVVKTAGSPAKIHLTPDKKEMRSDGEDMVFVYVDITDERDVLCPHADNTVHFKLEGPAEIVAIGNGDPTSTEPFHNTFRKVFHGKCVVYIRSIEGESGVARFIAESEGLKGCELILNVR
jgi:beta-galactosidase